jgi:hypothetical protein
MTLTRYLYWHASSNRLVRRTNLLGPSVAHLPVFKVLQVLNLHEQVGTYLAELPCGIPYLEIGPLCICVGPNPK